MKDKILNNLTKVGFPNSAILKELKLTIEESYIIVHGLKSCNICENKARFISFNKGYAEYCGKKCSQKHKWTEKSKQSGIKNRDIYYKNNPKRLKERNINVSNTNKIVWGSNTTLRKIQTKLHIKTKRQNRLKLNLDDMDLYYRLVNSYTNSNNLAVLNNFNKRGKTGTDIYQLDHKYSIRAGFENNILPCYIGNINNLEMLPYLENNSKGRKCSIDIIELCENFIC